jgi:hypothetical protein
VSERAGLKLKWDDGSGGAIVSKKDNRDSRPCQGARRYRTPKQEGPAGHLAKPLKEYFGKVQASDIHAYGYGKIADFLPSPIQAGSVDWVITNPPFRLAEDFIKRAMIVANNGVAILARTVFIESVGRYREIFEHAPPARLAQFTERVPMVKGRLDKKASTATGYAWIVWKKLQMHSALHVGAASSWYGWVLPPLSLTLGKP